MSIDASSPSMRDHRLAALVASLRACPMFDALPHADLEAIAEGCQLRRLQKGEILFHEGDAAEGFYVIQLGQIGVFFITPEGREQIFSVFRAPESFAEVVMAMHRFPAGAKALEYSCVILVRRAPFRELLGRKPELALQMLASMSMHLKELLRLLQDSRGRQIEARLAEWLLQQSPAAAAGCPAVFELPVAKKVLASQLGVTSETLSRTFARFRSEKVIQVIGATICVLNSARLRAYAVGTG